MGAGANDRLRSLIAEEAARLILDEGVSDYELARSKASRRLNARGKASLPTPIEIKEAVATRRMIFGLTVAEEDEYFLQHLALKVMREFSAYQPRLIGSLVEGVITPATEILVYLIAEDAKVVAIDLLNRGMEYRAIDETFPGLSRPVPGFTYEIQNVPVSLFVFPKRADRDAVKCVSGGKVKEASLKDWEAGIAGKS